MRRPSSIRGAPRCARPAAGTRPSPPGATAIPRCASPASALRSVRRGVRASGRPPARHPLVPPCTSASRRADVSPRMSTAQSRRTRARRARHLLERVLVIAEVGQRRARFRQEPVHPFAAHPEGMSRDFDAPIIRPLGSLIGASKIGRDLALRTRRERMNRFLSESSAALADLSDYENTLQKLVHLAVPAFADLCAVDILRDDASVRRLALIQGNSALDALSAEMLEAHPATDQHGAMQVLRSGDWARGERRFPAGGAERAAPQLAPAAAPAILTAVRVPVRSQRSAVGALSAWNRGGSSRGRGPGTIHRDSNRAKEVLPPRCWRTSCATRLAPIRNAARIIPAQGAAPEPTDPHGPLRQMIERQVHQMSAAGGRPARTSPDQQRGDQSYIPEQPGH